jgi:hypothetical protein
MVVFSFFWRNEYVKKSCEHFNVFMVVVVAFQLSEQSVHITTQYKAVSSNPAHGEVFSIQHYVIKFISEGRSL